MPRKSKKPVRKQTDSPTVKVVGQVQPDTATDDSWDRGHEGRSDGMGVRARTDSSAPTGICPDSRGNKNGVISG